MDLKIYLDYAAACPMKPEDREKYCRLLGEYSVNPHGGTCFAGECRRQIALTERRLLEMLNLQEGEAEVIWTSGATEALNLAVNSVPGKYFLIDGGAHPAMVRPAWEKTGGKLDFLKLDRQGRITGLDQRLEENPVDFLGICDLNNETGVWQDPLAVAGLRGRRNFLYCLDASQSFGRRRIDFRKEKLDYLVISSRKIGGPVNLGALVCRKGVPVKPLLYGGGQQQGRRSGTLDTAAVLLFGSRMENVQREYVRKLDDYRKWNRRLRDELRAAAPDRILFYSPDEAAPHILYFGFRGYEGALLTRILAEEHGIQVSSGSACSAEDSRPSSVLLAMGWPKEDARWAVRLSMGEAVSEQDVTDFLRVIPGLLKNY